MPDAVLPFPILLTTIAAVVVFFHGCSFWRTKTQKQQWEQVKHFMVMVVASTAGTKKEQMKKQMFVTLEGEG